MVLHINTGTISSLQSAQPLTSTPPTATATAPYPSTLPPTSTPPTATAQNPYPYAYQNQIQNSIAQQQSPSNPDTMQTQQQPIANAGAPQTVFENSIVTLDGRASYNPAGDNIIGYEWRQLPTRDAAPVHLTGSNTATPTFTPPILPADNVVLAFSLRVIDSNGIISNNPAIAYVPVKHNPAGGQVSGIANGTLTNNSLPGMRCNDSKFNLLLERR
jgi:hypothetical protein